MRKKSVAFILAVMMLTGLTGCGQSNTAPTEDGASYHEESEEKYEAKCAESNEKDYRGSGDTAESAVGYAESNSPVSAKPTGDGTNTKASFATDASSSVEYDMTEGNYYVYEDDLKQKDLSGEEYDEFDENYFESAVRNPLSTFAADVDTASYANLRRMITYGYGVNDIPTDAIRIEEMLNYFNYDSIQPKQGEPFGVTMEMNNCPWNQESQLLMLGLATEEIDFSESPATNLVFLLDVSGSMYDEDKLPLLQQSFLMLADELSDKDCVSIVTYAGSDEVVLKGVNGGNKKKIKAAIEDLEASGSTAGSRGIQTAYEIAEKYFIKGGNNRVILATDGDLNVGLTTEDELEDLISEKKESGVFLSVLGFGTGNLKDNKMEILADKGNGNYHYIDSIKEAKKVLVNELGGTMMTVAKDVKFQVEFNPEYVKGYRLIGYENRALEAEDFDDDNKDGGEIGTGHSVTALYEIAFKDFDKALDSEAIILNVRYKEPLAEKSKLLTYPVTKECFSKKNPSDDWKFAACVAETGMILRHSEYAGELTITDVEDMLRTFKQDDEYKEEFTNLVGILANGYESEDGYYWTW